MYTVMFLLDRHYLHLVSVVNIFLNSSMKTVKLLEINAYTNELYYSHSKKHLVGFS